MHAYAAGTPDGDEAIDDLEAGRLQGRGILVP